MDAVRDERLTLELLEEIAKATAGGQPINSTEMETRRGSTREQVWRELGLLWNEGRIRAIDVQDLSDPGPSLIIQGLTGDGWALLNELRKPNRAWLARHKAEVVAVVIGSPRSPRASLWR